MSTDVATDRSVIRVENIGGIAESTVEFDAGTTVLSGRNASNRTSLLQALMAACGSEHVSLKGDADRGKVELMIGGEEYTRTLERRNGTVVVGGDPMLDDPVLADKFAFLLESNEARRAIATGDDLREVLMGPVDTAAIETEVDRLQSERLELEDDLDDLESLNRKLPGLEQRKQSVEDEIEDKGAELRAKETELEAADADLDQTRNDQSELKAKLDELREIRSALDDVRYRIETEEESIENLRNELEEVESERSSLPKTPATGLEELDAELDRLRARRSTIDGELSKLRSVIELNQEMLDGADNIDILAALRDEESVGVSANQLVGRETVVCWTCCSEVERGVVEATVDRLRDLHHEKVDSMGDIEDELDDLTSERRELKQQADRRTSLDQRVERLEAEIGERQDKLEDLADKRTDLQSSIEELEAAVDALEDEVYSEILELHRETNQLEFELDSLESDRDEVREEIQSIEERLSNRGAIADQLEEVKAEITDLRTRIERLEKEAVEQFNEHMADVLELLDYENIARVWIERIERGVRKGNRKVVESRFDLHVVRETPAGTTYEDTIDHLSESEREVVGLVFALAGYLVHEVYERCPFMVLDSLEALDSARIATLIDYLSQHAEYLVVALLPEDAQALDDDYQYITGI